MKINGGVIVTNSKTYLGESFIKEDFNSTPILFFNIDFIDDKKKFCFYKTLISLNALIPESIDLKAFLDKSVLTFPNRRLIGFNKNS